MSLQDLERALIAADKAGNVEDATRLANAVVTMRSSQHKPLQATDDMSGPQKFLAGVGKAFVDPARGVGQALGMVDQQSVDEARARDKVLTNTGAGMAGNIFGSLVPAAATLAIPGAGGVLGAGLVSGAFGAAQPTSGKESRLENTADGFVLGMGAQAGIGKAAKYAGDRLAAKEAQGAVQSSQNSVRDATLRGSQEAGYVIPPSQGDAGIGSRILEGISGKYKTNQAAGIKNQSVTDTLARKALGLAEDQPITREAMQTVRDQSFAKGYAPLANVGVVETDRAFVSALDKIASSYQGAARSFPGAVKGDVAKMVDSLRVGSMDVGDALKMTRILRDDASKAYAGGDKALGKATREASKAIEDQVERALQSAGADGAEALKNFREARTLMAKAHGVERAIVEAGGHVNAKVLGTALQRGKPLTDELRTIGAFANNFGDVAGLPKSGWANPITALDAFGTAGMASMGAGPMSVALPAARMASRSAILSGPYQKAFVGPQSYGPGLLEQLSPALLKELEKRGAGGLMGLLANPAQ